MARPLYQWTLELVGQMAADRMSRSGEKVTASPMPSAKVLRRMQGLIVDMMMVLAPTVFSEAGEGENDPKVGAIYDAYDALEDALQALEEV